MYAPLMVNLGSYLIAQYWSVLCLGDWEAVGTEHLRFFIYRASHPAPEQRDAYGRSVATTGLRFHDPGPDWFGDPNAICAGDDEVVPSAYQQAMLHRHFGEESLYDNSRRWGNPWDKSTGGWEEGRDSRPKRLAALLVWFMGRSIPDFHFDWLEQVDISEVRRRIHGFSESRMQLHCINGWAGMGLPHVFGTGVLCRRHWPGLTSAPPPRIGLYVMCRNRAAEYGSVVRDFPVVARVPVPIHKGVTAFDFWADNAAKEVARTMPHRRVVLAGERGFFQSTQDAVMFRLAVDAS